jgi:hypothetical protein
MKTKTVLFTVLCGAILVAGMIGCATGKDGEAKLQAQAKVSRSEAEKIALAKMPGGTIKEGEIEKEKGKVVRSFNIATPGTMDITEVQVDAMSGELVAIEKESPAQLRTLTMSDTCSNPYRTPFQSCRTVVGAKRRSEGVIKGCPTGVKVLRQFWCSFGAPLRGDVLTVNLMASSRRLFGRAVSGGNELSNCSSRCRRSLRVTDSPARPNRRVCD